MKRNKRWLIAFVVAAAMVVAAFVMLDSGAPQPAPVVRNVPVTTATVTARDVPIELEGLGRVAAFSTIIVRSQITGVISRLAFTDGQYVTRGTLLA